MKEQTGYTKAVYYKRIIYLVLKNIPHETKQCRFVITLNCIAFITSALKNIYNLISMLSLH